MKINCFIINLKRCPEKRQRIEDRMKRFPEISYEIYDAIDGQELTDEYMEKYNYSTLDSWNDPFHKRKITKGEIGCTLSHYDIYRKASKLKDDITLVLEDDADFSNEFLESLNISMNELKKCEWDMCYLGRKKMDDNETNEYVGESDYIIYPGYSYWTIGYLINKNFCNSVLNSELLQKIIPIDEFLQIIGKTSTLSTYEKEYKTRIDIKSYHKNIIFPERDAFKYSDTEICSYLSNNKSELLILTVATDENEPLERFIHSCNNFGLRYKVLGLDYEWTGGNMSAGPGGGMKLNLLKEELKEYDSDDIIFFSDSYDVIFLSGENDIMKKYKNFESDVVFAGEKTCWPNKSMEPIFKDKGPYKYINSGGFIGKVGIIREIIDVDFEDSYDDQYLIHSRYEKFINHIKIDTKCEIFQTSCNDTDDLEIIFDTNRLQNNLYHTFPCHYHGNGSSNVKVRFNNYCNYLLKTWNNTYQYRGSKLPCKKDKNIYLFIYKKTDHNLSDFIKRIKKLDYPKDKISINIYLNEIINNDEFIGYREINIKKIRSQDNEYTIRDNSIEECINGDYDYYLNIDTICMIGSINIITELMEYNKLIVSPLLRLGNKNWTNFWGEVNVDGWYTESFNYFDIIEDRHKGCWNASYINNIYLIKSEILDKIRGFYSRGFEPSKGCDMSFCENCRSSNIFLYTCNEKKYGLLYDEEGHIEDIEEPIGEDEIKKIEIEEVEDEGDSVYRENILDEDLLNQLRGFALTCQYKTIQNGCGYETFQFRNNKLPISEIDDIINQLIEKYPQSLKNTEFDYGQFIRYDTECKRESFSSYPSHFISYIWLTPDSSLYDNDKKKNNFTLWDIEVPHNIKEKDKQTKYLVDNNGTKDVFYYKYNSSIVFDGTNFNEISETAMKSGIWNQKICLKLMFKKIEENLTLLDYNNDTREKYLEKYFDPIFIKSINNYNYLPIEEPINDVLQFPIVNDTFCKELIQMCEGYGKWSGASNNDTRIGYENVPSNDIHFTEINFHKIWEKIIKTYIAPIVSYHWGDFLTTSLNIGFVVKYEYGGFYKLGPHHDSSSYTINISLNDEYEGGEVKFIKKNHKIRNKKGYALIHPGRITHYHEGLPVTSGTKFINVSFVY